MSIIVDALERVQSDRENDQTILSNNTLSNSDKSPNDHRSGSTSNNGYKKLFITILFFILGFNLFSMIKNSNKNESQFPIELYSSDTPVVKTVKEESDIVKFEPAHQEDESENVADAEFLAAFDEESDFIETELEPISQSTLQSIPENINGDIVEARLPGWIEAGKTALQDNSLTQAVLIWNKGFSMLDEQTKIISIMINRVPELAKQTLNKLHENQIDAFAVLGLFRDKPAYFTLALWQEKNAKIMMSRIEHVINSKPYESTQGSTQKRIDRLTNQNEETKKTLNLQNTNTQKISQLKTKPAHSKKISSEKRILIAQEAVIGGDYKKAIQKLRPMLFNNKRNWEVLFWIGSAKLGLGLFDEADDYFRNALLLNADIPQLWIQRAVIAQEKNNHIAALKFLHTAQTLAPNTPEVVLNIAYSNDALGDRNGAVFAYREFLSLTKNNSQFSQQRQAVDFRLEELGF